MENGECIGSQIVDYDYLLQREDEIYDIELIRQKRLERLVGKYVITTKGRASGKTVYYQDQDISNKGYWTQFMSNALGFVSLDSAKLHANKFKYGNPKIGLVTAGGNVQYIQ